MATIVLDSKSHQGIRELALEKIYYGPDPRSGNWQNKRLTGLKNDVHSNGHQLSIINVQKRCFLKDSVLILASRNNRVPFTRTELQKIKAFHQGGGGILLMASHPPGFVKPQNQVVEALQLPIEFLMNRGGSVKCLCKPHETSLGCEVVEFRTFCGIRVHSPILSEVVIESPDPHIGELAVAIEGMHGAGRVMAMGTSGHIASMDDLLLDLYASASNSTWTLNIINWLARI